MINAITQRPLRVSTEAPDYPYNRVAESQLEEVRRLLDEHGIRYRVDELAISLDGAPEVTVIYLGRGGDARAVQAILDSID